MTQDIYDFISQRTLTIDPEAEIRGKGAPDILIMDESEELDGDLAAYLLSVFPKLPARDPGGWTVAEAAPVWGIRVAAAGRRCKKMVADGLARVEACWIDGRQVNVYYPVEVEK